MMKVLAKLLAVPGWFLLYSVVIAEDITHDPVWPYANRGIASITVGPDAGCNFASVVAAVTAQQSGGTVRVMSGTYTENQTVGIFKSLQIIGGYPDCIPSSTPTGRSTINRSGDGLVVDILYGAAIDSPVRTINLENLVIRGGNGSGFDSGGVVVEGRPGRLLVNFRNVEISNNNRAGVDDNGAGLRIITTGDREGINPFVTLDNLSSVANNTSGGDGGGIHCNSVHNQGSATTLRLGTTLIFNNSATNGGGIALNGCENVFLYSGGPVFLIFPTGGIVSNTATNNGGGLYMRNGAIAALRGSAIGGFGDADEAALIAGNMAEFGGGVYVRDAETRLTVEDAYVTNNDAALRGGGFYATLNSRIDIGRNISGAECQPPVSGGGTFSRPRCSVIDGNSAGGGGAFYVAGSSEVNVSRSYIRENQGGSGLGSIATVGFTSTGAPASVLNFEGSLIANNEGGFGLNATNGSRIRIVHSTLHDHVGVLGLAESSAGFGADIAILSSVINEPDDGDLFRTSGDGFNTVEFECVLSNRPTSNWGATAFSNSAGDVSPQFVDEANGDFRLGDRSPAIDYCDGIAGPQFAGLDGNSRGAAWAGPEPDFVAGSIFGGTFDLGAWEMVFEPRSADLQLSVVDPDLFINATQSSIEFTLAVVNNGPAVAYADMDVVDAVTTGVLNNRQWTCVPPPGITCTPASGSGAVSTQISDLMPDETVLIGVTADLIDTSSDRTFNYAAVVMESEFNQDTNQVNNDVAIQFRIGLFADSFESPASF